MSDKQQTFISVVGILSTPQDVRQLAAWLNNLHGVLERHFSDYEFVLINNKCLESDIQEAISPLPESLRKSIFLLNLSAQADKNNALLAGLDRCNGDYALIFEFDFTSHPELVQELWDKTREGFDIVYLRAQSRKLPWTQRLLYKLFYFILSRYSGLRVDAQAHHSRIISRRALNSLLRLRENSHYLKAIYSLVGYNTSHIEVEEPLYPEANQSLGEQFRTALVAITSFTTFLRSVLLWIFLGSSLVAGVAIFNAVKVRFTNVDIFGTFHETLSGWTFLVVLMSIFFAITCLNLYIMSIYLSNIYTEIKNRPPYIIESVKRF
ncbi:MAG: glycosyltransferase [Saprospiraceae bacterium]